MLSTLASAADPVATPVMVPAPTPAAAPASTPVNALPAMSFYGSIADDELFDLIKKSDQFVRIDKELFGSPLHLRVMHTLQPCRTPTSARSRAR